MADRSSELFDDQPSAQGTQPASKGRNRASELFDTPSTPAVGLGASSAGGRLNQQMTHQPSPFNPLPGFARGVGNLGYGMLKGAADLPQGIAQLAAHGVGAVAGPGMISDKVGQLDQYLARQEAQYQAETPGSIAAGMGRVFNPTTMLAASKLPMAATLAGRVGQGAAAGAAFGAATPVTNGGGDFATEKGKQVLAGATFGGGAPILTGAMARTINPDASRNAQLALLRKEGVQPTIGQALGGRAAVTEEKLQSLPIMGDAISGARRAAMSQFEAAAHNRALAPIGDSLPPGVAGRDAINYTEGALKNAYNTVLNKIGAITPDQQFTDKVSSLQKMVNGFMMPKAEKQKFASSLSDLKQSFDKNGVITSDAYKLLESSLGNDAKKLAASTNVYEGKISGAVKQLQGELRDMLQRQAGPNAAELQASNAGWANFKRVQNAASKLGATDGEFSVAQFQNAVRALDKSKDKGAFSRGSALGQDLGDAGKSVLGGQVPNSFTADRKLLAGGLGGVLAANPATYSALAGLLAGAGAYTPQAQRALVASVANRPASAAAMADSLRQAAPAFAPLLGAAGASTIGPSDEERLKQLLLRGVR